MIDLKYNAAKIVWTLQYLNNKHGKKLLQSELEAIVRKDPEHWLYNISGYGIALYLDEAVRRGWLKLVDRPGTDEVGYAVKTSMSVIERLLDKT